MVIQIGKAIPDSFTVVDREHAFYEATYDRVLEKKAGRRHLVRNLFLGPWTLGSASARALGVIYVGERGFLSACDDERAWELEFLRRRGRAAVVVFTGNDIRSPQLMTELAATTGFDNIGAILARSGAPFDTPGYEAVRERRAAVCDRLASAIFSASVDQLSHLRSEVHPFPYLYPDANFLRSTDKFTDLSEIRIVHAPSNPLLKGTAAVREAIGRLLEVHPNVTYQELTDVDNAAVRAALADAHIVVNQLHAYMPGVFGIEALAHRCVMLCSADPALEPAISGADGAWIVATADTLFDRLNELLSAPDKLEAQAERGYDWALSNASQSGRGAILRDELSALSQAANASQLGR
ncbi:hypothetical protein MHM582_1114 [Microbacterium sp. HM58-2]|nr:hypothetical protein MHM582_1114 [Microbacterium sp. HM58-2]